MNTNVRLGVSLWQIRSEKDQFAYNYMAIYWTKSK